MFAKLRLEVSLFEFEEGGGLRHRQDVRRLMMRTMLDDPERARKVAEINRLAVDYYAARTGPPALAEELYHRLMRDENPRSFTSRWDPELRGLLSSTLEEPLPDRARHWLERRLGRTQTGERHAWEQDEWELDAAERAGSWLESRDPKHALEVLSERTERLPGSPLYELEAQALLGLERLEEAEAALGKARKAAASAKDKPRQLKVAQLALELVMSRGTPEGIVEATDELVRLADRADDQLLAIDTLCKSAEELRKLGSDKSSQAGCRAGPPFPEAARRSA